MVGASAALVATAGVAGAEAATPDTQAGRDSPTTGIRIAGFDALIG